MQASGLIKNIPLKTWWTDRNESRHGQKKDNEKVFPPPHSYHFNLSTYLNSGLFNYAGQINYSRGGKIINAMMSHPGNGRVQFL